MDWEKTFQSKEKRNHSKRCALYRKKARSQEDAFHHLSVTESVGVGLVHIVAQTERLVTWLQYIHWQRLLVTWTSGCRRMATEAAQLNQWLSFSVGKVLRFLLLKTACKGEVNLWDRGFFFSQDLPIIGHQKFRNQISISPKVLVTNYVWHERLLSPSMRHHNKITKRLSPC